MEEKIRRAAEENLGNILSKTKINDKLPLKSRVWARLNPAYEGLVSAFMRHVKDDELIAQTIANLKEIDEVGELMAIQSIMGMLSGEKSKIIESELKKRTPIEEITIRAALELAENKRTRDGTVLYQINSLPQKTQKDFYEKIKKINSNQIYISKSILDYLKTNEKEFRKNRIIKYSIIAALISGFLIGSYFFKKNYDIRIEKQPEAVYEMGKSNI